MIPSYVKQKSWWHEMLPFTRGWAFTIFPHIYLPAEIYTDLLSPSPSAFSLGTLAHEETHLVRQKEMGIWKYGLRYLFNPRFRYAEELAAIKPQMAIIKKHGQVFDVSKRAELLSGFEYLWCVDRNKATKDLLGMWNKI